MLVAALALASGCGGSGSDEAAALPTGSETVELDPASFSPDIDHPYWPMEVGTVWTYRETDAEGAEQRVVVTVTDRTRDIQGIQARVVHDVVTEDGEVVEDTFDWYAQDEDGNVWYMGEDTTAFEEGKPPDKEGSWEHGVDGALAGILLPADPEVGMSYRQEYYEREAEDMGEILSLDESVEVPYGKYDGVLKTKDWSPLEPDLVENKFYARGVGPVLATTVSGGTDREELVDLKR